MSSKTLRKRTNKVIEKTEKDRDYQALSACYSALDTIAAICGSSLATHFGEKTAKSVERALRIGRARL